MDPVGIKKRLEDYEQMLQYYTLMWTKNKMKDSKAKSKEWWEVAKEYFTKELEKNLAQIELMKEFYDTSWKLIKRIFQISFVAVQQVQRYQTKMKRQKQGPVEQLRRRKYKPKNHMTSEVGSSGGGGITRDTTKP